MIKLEDLFEAYYNCRKKKRRSMDSLGYEIDYEENLVSLCDEVNNRTYKPSTSTTFIVRRPLFREVFAAAFRDRVIHHYIALRLEPLLEKQFTSRTFNCRRNKGALYGVKRLDQDIKMCSNNYTEDCYILKMDIKSFFMSIPKTLLNKRMNEFIDQNYEGEDKQDLKWLSQITIMHHPEYNCERRSPISLWNNIPNNKSLFTNGYDLGLAIGNLTSQLNANFFMDRFDHYLEDALHFPYHGRYVDDFYLVDKDKARLLQAIPVIRNYLRDNFHLILHPNKVYLQHYTKGVKFTGAVVKPGRIYISNRTTGSLRRLIYKLNQNTENMDALRTCIAGMNSYFGLLRHCNSYGIRRKAVSLIDAKCWEYIYVSGHFDKISLKKKYRN